MSSKRMICSIVTGSDIFMDMPLSAQALYFHLNIRADDDGFVDCPKSIQRSLGCHDDDIKLLIAKGFIIPFPNGVIVITHWRIHNTIQKDRYKPTVHQTEFSQLILTDNKVYSLNISVTDTNRIQTVSETETQYRLGKDRSDQNRVGEGSAARTYGEFNKILLSDNEYSSLLDEYGEKIISEYIRRMDEYLYGNPSKKYVSHYTQLKRWLRQDNVRSISESNSENSFDVNDPWR